MDNADTNYEPPIGDRLPSEYNAPSGSWEECAIRQATVTITMDRKAVQALVKPSLPSVLPPGFIPKRRPAPGIYDVIGAPRTLEDRRAFFSGGPAGYSGAPDGWGQQ
jgi:hypothetical protein